MKEKKNTLKEKIADKKIADKKIPIQKKIIIEEEKKFEAYECLEVYKKINFYLK